MAYKIKKNRKGHYTLLNVDAPPAALHELERQQRISDDVIRYLTVKVDELEEEPSAMMRTKGRDDRGPRGPRPPFRNDDEKPKETATPDKSAETDDVKADAKPAAEAKPADEAKADAKQADEPKAAADETKADTKAPEDAAETQAADDATKPDTAEAKED